MSDRYAIVSGTNRKGSNTLKIASFYEKLLKDKNAQVALISLEGRNLHERNAAFEKLEQEVLLPATKFIFIAPEYNGSIPGVLKMMIDLSDYRRTWKNKKALLTGVSTGRAGNLRGMEHLTGILNYLNVTVHPNKLPISSVDRLIDKDGIIHDTSTLRAIQTQVEQFMDF